VPDAEAIFNSQDEKTPKQGDDRILEEESEEDEVLDPSTFREEARYSFEPQ